MRVEIIDPIYTDDLVAFLGRCDCTVRVLAPGVLDVEPRALPVDRALRRPEVEVDAYLGVWTMLRGVSADLTPCYSAGP